jgi:DNA polymerase-1
MVTSDMQAAEVRLAADFSKDKLLMDSILKGVDMHSKLASVSYSIIFGTDFTVSKSHEPVMVKGVKLIPNDLRDVHKSATFCKFYKGGPARIYGVLGKYINLFHKKNATNVARNISLALDRELIGLSKYLDGVIAEANKTRKLRTKFGRVRYFKENAYGDAANLPIQGANGDAIKIAMVQVDKYLTENGYGRLLMSVHDELVCSIKEEYAEECAVKIKEIMSQSLGKFLETLSGDASVTVGDYWSK